MHTSKGRAKAKALGNAFYVLRFLPLMSTRVWAFECWADLNSVTWEGD